MPPKPPAAEAQLRSGAGRAANVGAWLRWAESLLAESGVALGQVATNPHDEALYLLLHALGLPLDSDASVAARKLSAPEQAAVRELFRRRVVERVPSAYLTREAWLGRASLLRRRARAHPPQLFSRNHPPVGLDHADR